MSRLKSFHAPVFPDALLGYTLSMLTTSVTICTRNRGVILRRCIKSLQNQTVRPSEIIVVDNASSDNTKTICKQFQKTLPIVYVYEPRIGLPYARNTSVDLASGDILTFIDDDCVADLGWIASIIAFFQEHPQAIGVIGKTKNAHPNNIYGLVEYAFYHRRLLQNIRSIQKTNPILSGQIIDFKNAAFKRAFIVGSRFSTTVPHGDVGDEDVELGSRLYQKNKKIFYNPFTIVSHAYSTSLSRLAVRNFWQGYADEGLKNGLRITTLKNPANYTNWAWLRHGWSRSLRFTHPSKTLAVSILIIVYPIFSKSGRLWQRVTNFFHWSNNIPAR